MIGSERHGSIIDEFGNSSYSCQGISINSFCICMAWQELSNGMQALRMDWDLGGHVE